MSSLTDYEDKFPFAHIERSAGGVLTLRFHHEGGPLKWGRAVHRQLTSLIDEIRRDRENRVVIITGTGDAFAPSRPFPANRSYDTETWDSALTHGMELAHSLLDIPVPVIAAVNGPVHLHAELVLLSDIVLATPDTVFQDMVHVLEDMVPGDGIQLLIPFLMGRIRGNYFLLTGQTIDAHDAMQVGLVNELVDRAELLARAHAIADKLLETSDMQLRYTRALLTHPLKVMMQTYLGYGFALEGIAAINRYSPERAGIS